MFYYQVPGEQKQLKMEVAVPDQMARKVSAGIVSEKKFRQFLRLIAPFHPTKERRGEGQLVQIIMLFLLLF